jgi:phenylpropionate dioxygenase-like ring-hydroxylating dioxygenase large terminal subunit
MYINFWYPVALIDEVTNDKPLQVQILGLKFVAFRDTDGTARVISDTCIHRGGSLGTGWIKDGRAICPYHGWQYDGTGKCVKIPTQSDDTKLPARAKVDSYPTDEKYGILFAFLGDLPEAERPPIYHIEQFDAEGWRTNDIVKFEVNAYYERSIENGLDAAHNEFVHPMQGGPSISATLQNHPIDVKDRSEWGSGFLQPYGGYAEREKQTIGAGVGTTRAGSDHHGPNTLITRIQFDDERIFLQVFFEAPIDESHTRIFFVNMRSFMLEPENDQKLIDINMSIAHEDIRIIESLDPVRTPDTTTKEMLTPADKPIVYFRRYLQDWEDKGWRIDRKQLFEKKGDVAFAVPSPGRRESKNWVLDPIPLVLPASPEESKLRSVK